MPKDFCATEQPRQLPLPRLDQATPMPDDFPVAGGWGYTKDDACLITDERESAPEDEPIGLDFEFWFIERRLIEELNAMPLEGELSEIRWKVRTQELERNPDGTPSYDRLTVLVTADFKSDLDALAGEPEGPASEGGADRHRALRFMNHCEYWFDISRVRGIPDDAEFSMRIRHGRITALHEQEE